MVTHYLQDGRLPEVRESDYRRDGNIFAILGVCRRALRRSANPPDVRAKAVEELTQRVVDTHSYADALAVTLQYVTLIADDEGDENA